MLRSLDPLAVLWAAGLGSYYAKVIHVHGWSPVYSIDD